MSGQIYLGSEAFVRRMQARLSPDASREIPRAQRRPAPRPLGDYLAESGRDEAIARAYLSGGHSQVVIAEATGLSVSGISRLIAAYEAKGKT